MKFEREQVVVHFAGGGGSCTGIEMAVGRSPDHAINHDAAALGMHRANHPATKHHIEDVFEVDPEALKVRGPLGAAWFSPDCKHFSKAKGGKPLDKRIRGLVLVMLRWAKAGTRVMFMENVEEIQTWGPLKLEKGMWRPDPAHKGRTWKAFLACMGRGISPDHPDLPFILEVLGGTVTEEECVQGFGYRFEARELRACDYGAPTIRKRLFAVFRADDQPIVWPEATHGDPSSFGPGDPRRPWRTIAECIDWQLPCPSIFLSRDAAKKARCKRPLAANTLKRIAAGMGKYVLHAKQPFIVSLTHQGGERVESVEEPSKTITGAHRGEKALVTAMVTEHANASSQRNMPADEPMRTACAEVKGGHFALVSGSMVKLRGTNIGAKADEPLHTASAGGQHHGLVSASLIRHFGCSVGQGVDEPSPTVMAGGQGKTGVVAACLAQHNGGFNTVDARGCDEPVSTLSSRGSQQQLVTASMAAYYGSEADGQGVDEPARTATTKPRLGLVESTAVQPMTRKQVVAAHRVARFLRAHGIEFEGEFATVAGFVIVDIGMRMLTPRELFRAQGFPETYVIDRATLYDPATGQTISRTLTKEEQIRMCGNSVCPPVAAALVAANVPEMRRRETPGRWDLGERRAA